MLRLLPTRVILLIVLDNECEVKNVNTNFSFDLLTKNTF